MAIDRPEIIGARARRLRLAPGYDQARTFCIHVGISDQALYNSENGRRRISLDECIKIVDKTGFSLEWIYRDLEHTLPMYVVEKIRQPDA